MANATLDITKSQLGKLLASENIRVEHRLIQGPYFDVEERVLALPIWKDVGADLYDLMIGHEVGHALFTPAEGWFEKVKVNGEQYKFFLNLVEDARIEKKMKRKYPGLRRPMFNGYTQLVDRGFFGVKWNEMNTLPLVDRMNLHFKLGARAGITFTADEQLLVDRVERAETWAEVLSATDELFKVAKKEKSEMQDVLDDLGADASADEIKDALQDYFDDRKQDTNSDLKQDENTQGTAEQSPITQDMNEASENKENTNSEKQDSAPASQKKQNSDTNNIEGGKGGISDGLLDKLIDYIESAKVDNSITEATAREKASDLIDEKAYPITYINLPKLDLTQWVIPAKVVYQVASIPRSILRDKVYNNFMSTNKSYVSYLVKEFELRRNAKQFAKARVSKTGELNFDKIWQYRLSEDLFLQSTIVPNGKNHGMLMVIDLSGSMQGNIAGTIEQIVSLSMFCRKVGIPFEVYGFNDNGSYQEELELATGKKGHSHSTRNIKQDSSLYINSNSFRLQQLLHSGMKLNEYNNSIKDLLYIAHAFSGNSWGTYGSYAIIPANFHLGGTPLDEAILVLTRVAQEFKERTKVEVLNTIILTDGDGGCSLGYQNNGGSGNFPDKSRLCIEDKATHSSVLVSNSYRWQALTLSLLDMYKQITGSRVIGYYLMAGRNYKSQVMSKWERYTSNERDYAAFEKQWAKEFKFKFFGINNAQGYDVYYMLPGDELEIEDVDMDSMLKNKTNITKNTLLSAFKKMQKSKQISRTFLNQFIHYVS